MPGAVDFERVAAEAALHHGVIRRARAKELGVTKDSVRALIDRGVLLETRPGVLTVAGSVDTWYQRLMEVTSSIRGTPVVSHRSAARLHELDGFMDDVLEVTVHRGQRVPGEAVVHQLTNWFTRSEIVVRHGIPCTGLVRTLCDLGSVVPVDRLERAVDDYQRQGRSLEALKLAAQRLHRPGQLGTKRLLTEVARRAGHGRVRDSWFERLVEECMRSPRIPGVERQYHIRDEIGRFVARVDLAVPVVRFGVEAHSRQFHTGPLREGADNRRDWKVTQQGWELMYVGWRDTESPRVVRAAIETIVARRARDLGIALPTGK